MVKALLLFQMSSSAPANTAATTGLVLVGELLVLTAYLLVAGILFYLALKRDDRERQLVLMLFGVIALMGAAVHMLNFWSNADLTDTLLVLRLIFGVVALIAAFLLFKAIPGLLAIPSQWQLQKKNAELEGQIEEREKAQEALRVSQQELEQRVLDRSAQVITANRELEREVQSRKRAEKQLISKNYELIKKNADLDDFVYYASRDLKGPVLNVSGLVDAIREELPSDNRDLNQLFERLDDSVSRIHRKLNNLAEVGRIQKSGEATDLEMVSLANVLEEVKARLPHEIRAPDTRLETDFSGAPAVFFSRANLSSLLFNLLSNSIKYRDPNRPLHLSLSTSREKGYLVLKVQDNGIGIDLEQYGQHLFSMFRRFHDHVEGSGIGLYIIKRIMENNRGKVEVESVQGAGTTFLLYFANQVHDNNARL